MPVRIEEQSLRSFCSSVLQKAGLRADDAALVTDVLVFADTRGIDSHGVVRLPHYLRRIEAGGTDPLARPVVVSESPGTLLLDAQKGMGQVACMEATLRVSERARVNGVAFAGVRGSAHNGALSYYAMKIAEREMVGFVFTNTTPLMAAWGGAERIIGNNPIAFAAPLEREHPFVFDAAMSQVAAGRVRQAAQRGEPIPPGWIVDREGRPSENPDDLEYGALMPFGGHKGYGLAAVVEILAGVLTGAGMLHQNPFWQSEVSKPLSIGHAFVAIDIRRFMTPEHFAERMQWMTSTLRTARPAAGSAEVLIPGDIEAREASRRRKEGIPIDGSVWDGLQAVSTTYDVPLPDTV